MGLSAVLVSEYALVVLLADQLQFQLPNHESVSMLVEWPIIYT
jgi:hypothetical protein